MNSEIVVELPGGQQIVSIIIKDSIHRLGRSVGETVHAVIKASDVMLAVE